MRRSAKQILAGLAAAALTTSLVATPAAADEPIPNPDTGLVFYSSNPTAVVARQAAPDDLCRAFPATASWLLAWSGGFQNVIAYRSDDCSGQPIGLGTFRSFTPGYFASYTTVSY